jgi:2-dehydropantoate 2-reductase
LVLSLQNGVDNAERLQALLGRQVVRPLSTLPPKWPGPAMSATMAAANWSSARPHSARNWSGCLSKPASRSEISDNVAGELWAKLILNCAYNALSAITQLPYARLVQSDGVEGVMRDVVKRVPCRGAGKGVSVRGRHMGSRTTHRAHHAGQYSSTAQDLARGKRSEIDHLNGYVLRQGEALGIATPVNRVLYAIVKLLEAR